MIAVTIENPRWRGALARPAALVRRVGMAALKGAEREGDVAVALLDDAAMQQLNATYRGKAKPTNVLAFPAAPLPGGAEGPLGDVALGLETISREASEQKKPLGDHVCHMVVHGILHLCGYDHGRAGEARAMESLETMILATLGVPDPYALRGRGRG
ncbi:MAG: rRNA maturation RNase YbeY [Alphaproteobacteria bacterium]|nr:rRNA maturation RNase YbeY [Alphaproteobacteria bacterium]